MDEPDDKTFPTDNDQKDKSEDLQEREHDSEQDEDQGDIDEEEEEEDEAVELDRYWPPPVNESVQLIGSRGLKTLSAFAFNHSGSRFAAGGFDHQVRIWDFEALDPARPETICTNEPCGQTVIKQLDYSLDDELILVIPTSCQATVMAADGLVDQKKGLCVKGDQYLSDMANTKGHVNMLNDGCWSPKDRETFITCSQDSTVRLWDVNKLSQQQKAVIKTRSPIGGLKAVPTSCKFSRDSLSVVAGCSDGTIMFWDTRRKFITTSACIKQAHAKGSEITGIDYSYGPNKICSRSEDGSCKIWDTRQLARQPKPLVAREGLDTMHSADCCFSPDDRLLVLGTSGTKSTPGQLLFLDSETLQTHSSMDMESADVSVIRSRWHPRINHIGYSCSNGMLQIAYEKGKSLGGFLSSQLESDGNHNNKRGVKRRRKFMGNGGGGGSGESCFVLNSRSKIITPHSLPLFRDDSSGRQGDSKRVYRPELPASRGATGAAAGGGSGHISRPAGSTLSSYIARNLAKPREGSGASGSRE